MPTSKGNHSANIPGTAHLFHNLVQSAVLARGAYKSVPLDPTQPVEPRDRKLSHVPRERPGQAVSETRFNTAQHPGPPGLTSGLARDSARRGKHGPRKTEHPITVAPVRTDSRRPKPSSQYLGLKRSGSLVRLLSSIDGVSIDRLSALPTPYLPED